MWVASYDEAKKNITRGVRVKRGERGKARNEERRKHL